MYVSTSTCLLWLISLTGYCAFLWACPPPCQTSRWPCRGCSVSCSSLRLFWPTVIFRGIVLLQHTVLGGIMLFLKCAYSSTQQQPAGHRVSFDCLSLPSPLTPLRVFVVLPSFLPNLVEVGWQIPKLFYRGGKGWYWGQWCWHCFWKQAGTCRYCWHLFLCSPVPSWSSCSQCHCGSRRCLWWCLYETKPRSTTINAGAEHCLLNQRWAQKWCVSVPVNKNSWECMLY